MILKKHQDIFMKRFMGNDETLEVYVLDYTRLSEAGEFLTDPKDGEKAYVRDEIASAGIPRICYAPDQPIGKDLWQHLEFYTYVVFDGKRFDFHFFEEMELDDGAVIDGCGAVDKSIYTIMGKKFDKEKIRVAIEYVRL